MPFDSVLLPSGYSIPGIVFGTGSDWRANPRAVDANGVAGEVVDAVKSALEAGFRAFDTAEKYKNEKSLGVALKDCGIPRDELFITSKIYDYLPDPAAEVRRQLSLLQVDYLDLYLIHTPRAVKGDLTFLSAWRWFEALVDQGLVRSFGVSNFEENDSEHFIHQARIKPAVNQISVYPYRTNSDTVKYCESQGITLQVYEVSTSLIREGEKGGPLDPVLSSIGADLSAKGVLVTPGQVLLAWAAAKGFVPVSTSGKPSRMKEYVSAGDFRLSPTQVAAIDEAGKVGAESGFGKYWSW